MGGSYAIGNMPLKGLLIPDFHFSLCFSVAMRYSLFNTCSCMMHFLTKGLQVIETTEQRLEPLKI